MRNVLKFPLARLAAVSVGGACGVLFLSAACFWLESGLTTAALTLLILLTLMSLLGNFAVSVFLAVVAWVCLNYFFVSPRFSLRMADTTDVVTLLAFLTTSIVITGLSVRVRRLANAKLEQTRADLARLARVASLGELTASIAHEINQPLAGVVSSGNACHRWLTSDPPNVDRALQSVERIVNDANRASQIIERVRNLSKNTPPEKSPVNINELILEILSLAHAEMEQHAISLRTQLSDDLPVVHADRVQLQQVILNLIINAVEALNEPELNPRDLCVHTKRNDPAQVLVQVSDSGKGLDPEKARHIFDAFYTTKREGMGMGLAISRGIIEAHGGRVWAMPNEPRGAILQFTLPSGSSATI
jgi:signal transduction histidine kinase